MKKLTQFLFLFLIVTAIHAQNNIGIGTSTPTAKLQINHKNNSSSPSLTLFDSTAGTGSKLLFAKENQGNSFSIVSNIGTLAANNTLDIRNTFSSGISLKGDGKVGINNVTSPLATLHVGGGAKINDTLNVGSDLNLGGALKVDGNAGLPGQALMKNTNGQLSWQFQGEFQNIQTISYSFGSTTPWTVPAGVTRIKVELWGGGGGAGSSGAGHSGAYLMAILNVTPGDVWSAVVGGGGAGGDPNGSKGDTSIFFRGGIVLMAMGGAATSSNIVTHCANYIATGTNNYMGIQGQTGRKGEYSYQNLVNSYFIFIQNANGADAPLMPNSGGGSGWLRTNSDGSNGTAQAGGNGSVPGGGGGLIYGAGGAGMILISY